MFYQNPTLVNVENAENAYVMLLEWRTPGKSFPSDIRVPQSTPLSLSRICVSLMNVGRGAG
jgi:hypothetical protein